MHGSPNVACQRQHCFYRSPARLWPATCILLQTEVQDELARLRAELTAALSMGGGGGHVDVMSVVLGPRSGMAAGAAGQFMVWP